MCICYFARQGCPCTCPQCPHNNRTFQPRHDWERLIHMFWGPCEAMCEHRAAGTHGPTLPSDDVRTGGRMPSCPRQDWIFREVPSGTGRPWPAWCLICWRHYEDPLRIRYEGPPRGDTLRRRHSGSEGSHHGDPGEVLYPFGMLLPNGMSLPDEIPLPGPPQTNGTGGYSSDGSGSSWGSSGRYTLNESDSLIDHFASGQVNGYGDPFDERASTSSGDTDDHDDPPPYHEVTGTTGLLGDGGFGRTRHGRR